jgi:hypothetical protein
VEPQEVYKVLEQSIQQHDSVCQEIYTAKYNLEVNDFSVNIVKHDKQRFLSVCEKCEVIYKYSDFVKDVKEKEALFAERRRLRQLALDPSLFNKDLIAKLVDVHKRDQALRGKKDKESLILQNQYDSLNLIVITDLFDKIGRYPSVSEVGYDNILVPYLVLQHQGDVAIREKYLPILERAVADNRLSQFLLNGYKERTLDMEEYDSKVKK